MTDVVKHADINRGTFYVYYRDVYDLLEKVENEMIEEFRLIHVENLPSPKDKYSHQLVPDLHPLLKQAVGFLEKNRMMVCALLRTSTSDGFKDKMMRVIEDFRLSVIHDSQEKEIFLTQFRRWGGRRNVQMDYGGKPPIKRSFNRYVGRASQKNTTAFYRKMRKVL